MASLLPDNFWVPEFDPCTFNTTEQIAALADRFGIRLPPLMIELLQTCPPSGKARRRYLKDFGTVIFEPDLESCADWTQQLYLIYLHDHGLIEENEWEFAGLFCIARDSFGDDAICLDYRNIGSQGVPRVSVANWHGVVKPISDTLDAFLGRLQRTDYDDNYCLQPQNGEQLWQRLENEFSLETTEPFQGRFQRDNVNMWISIHPNLDSKSFEPFLEEPADCWILQCTAEKPFREELRRRLDGLGIQWKLLYEARC